MKSSKRCIHRLFEQSEHNCSHGYNEGQIRKGFDVYRKTSKPCLESPPLRHPKEHPINR
jgi:hypothetical protein